MNKVIQAEYQEALSIDQVLDQLDEIIALTVSENNLLCCFAYVYRRTTYSVQQAIISKRFENPSRMEKMDVLFANIFIRAFYDFRASTKTSAVWNLAFSPCAHKMSYAQHILLCMNAHINLDLSVAAATVSKGQDIILLKNDFMIINEILSELTNELQKGLGKVSIMMNLLDIFGFRSDEKIIHFSIKKARDFAWLNSLELALLDENESQRRIDEIDKRVLVLGQMIQNPPGRFLSFLLRCIAFFEISDADKIIRKLRQTES